MVPYSRDVRAENPEGAGGDIPIQWGSDAMAELLSRLDLRYVALVPGSSYRGLHDSLVNYNGNRDPRLLVCLHEEHAIAIAHGYAKVTGSTPRPTRARLSVPTSSGMTSPPRSRRRSTRWPGRTRSPWRRRPRRSTSALM